MRFLLSIFISIFLLVQLPATHVHAATPRGPWVRTWHHLQASWLTFSSFFDHFNGFFQNACHREDIYNLQDQLETLRARLRGAAYRSQDDTFKHLNDEYTKLQMEYQYVLKAFTTGKWNPPWADTFVCRDNALPDTSCAGGQVEIELKKEFVEKERLTKEEFQEYLTEFREQYGARIPDYKDCRIDENLNSLLTDWNSFAGNFREITETLKRAVAQQERRRQQRQELRKERLEKNAAEGTQQDFWDRWVQDVRLNEVPAKEGLENILEAYKENMPFQDIPIQAATEAAQQEETRYTTEFSETALRAQYEILYGNTGDELVASMVKNLQELRDSIDFTASFIPSHLTPHVKEIHEKQCEG